VAGSDVAQLYLGDPASAAQPPRQLEGFQKVTLKPGQSTTVRFRLSGHDLSYWNDKANGWVLPDGQFGVYVGDSSALANLPLHGGFTVTRSIGARYATASAPAVVTPGSPAKVTATVVNDGDYAMPGATFRLNAPRGWSVSPAQVPAAVGPHQSATATFRVTAPADATPGSHTLTARVSYRAGSGSPGGSVSASATVAVPYASLSAAYDNPGISDNSDVAAGNYDGGGDSYSAQALAAGTPTPLTPGSQATIGGTTFTWPNVAAGTNDNVLADGQTVAVSGSGTDLGLLGASQNGTATGTVTVNYTDGSSQSFTLNMADWYADAPATGNQILTTTSSWNQTTPSGSHPVSVYFASVPLQAGKTVASVTLPSLPDSFGGTEMHIFAVAAGSGTPTNG
jgi:beta-glucosidase